MINKTEGELVEGVLIRIVIEGEVGVNGKRFHYNDDRRYSGRRWKGFSLYL